MRFSLGGVVAAASLLAAALVQAQAPAGDVNPVILKVNGESVYASDVSFAVRGLQVEAQRQGRQAKPEELVPAATDRVVDQKLLAQEALRRGMKADQQIAALVKRAGGREKLEQMLGQGGTTVDHYRSLLLEMNLIQAFVSGNVQPQIKVSDEDVKAFYEANPSLFEVPEQVHARHILFKVAEGATEEVVNTVKAKAENAAARAKAGEDFATLAKELSEGPSGPGGGDLGFFTKDRMVKPFAEAAFAMKVGEVSGPVRTRFGFHIIKVEERRKAHTSALDEVKDRIHGQLVQKKTGERVLALLKKLRESAKIVDLTEAGTAATKAGPPAE